MLQPILTMMFSVSIFQAEVTNKTVIQGMAAAIVTLCGVIATMAIYIVNAGKSHQKKVDALYDARIEEMRAAHDLVDTLMKVVGLKKEGGP